MRESIRKSNYFRSLALDEEITEFAIKKRDKNYENNSSYESVHLNLDFFNGYGGFNKENNSYG